MSTLRRWCPVHEIEETECGTHCLPERAEFARIRHDFRVCWRWRSRHDVGARRRCSWCDCLFVVVDARRRYCNESHARAAQRGRRNERLVAA